jgi:hypothetical protein
MGEDEGGNRADRAERALAAWLRWAEWRMDQGARATEKVTDGDVYDYDVREAADWWTLQDGWALNPDDPETRRYLVEDEGYEPDFADAVLARMRAAHPHGGASLSDELKKREHGERG